MQHRFKLLAGLQTGMRLALLLLAVASSGCSIFGGNKDPSPPAKLERFDAAFKVQKVWSRDVGGNAELLRLSLGPASNGDVVIAMSSKGRVSAFDAVKGRKLWSVKTKLPLAGGAGVDSRYVAAGSIYGVVVLLSLEDGKEIWRTNVASEVLSAPALAPGAVIVRTVDGRITALSTEDGDELWFNQQSMPRLSLRGVAAPIVIAGAVVFGFYNGRLAAYQLSDGDVLWDVMLAPPSGRTEIERLIDLDSTAVLVGNDLYAISYQGRLASVAAESGQLLWSQELSSYSGIAGDSTSIYVATTDSELMSVSSASGRELWRLELLLNRGITGPVLHERSVVVGDYKGYLHWFDVFTGELEARVRLDRKPVSAAPLVVGDLLYATSDGGEIAAYRIVRKRQK